MKHSNNPKVQAFINDIESHDSEKFTILQALRQQVFTIYPQVGERMMYGGIMFSLETDFGGLFVYKKHLSFEFSNGSEMDDPNQLLEGSGKYRRHLKFSNNADIDTKELAFFLHQVVS